MTIGIVAGLDEELAAFAPGAPGETVPYGHMTVRRTAWGRHEVVLCCAGIGKVAAANAASLLHHRHDASFLIIVGTAGATRPGPAVAYRITHAYQHDYGACRPEGFARYTPGRMPIGPGRCSPYRAFDLTSVDLPTARIAAGDMFVESPEHAAEIARALDCQLFDMETAAVAQVATGIGLDWAAIKATTDTADEGSAASFTANLLAAADLAARGAEAFITCLG